MCLYPLKAVSYRYFSGEKFRIQLCKNQDSFIEKNKNFFYDFNKLDLPCGNCFECAQEYSNQWAYRIYCESLTHSDNCFITLTYESDYEELNKRDLQLFLKRLRKKISPIKVRYFACGEYGGKRLRPHYHLILFGFIPNDLDYFYTTKKNEKIYKSKFISDLWCKGFISVGKVSINSSKYCAKYLQKEALKDKRLRVIIEFFGAEKPFTLMSTKPGIGYNYFINNLDLLNTDKIYSNKGFIKIPRYFLKVAEDQLGLSLYTLKKKRNVKAELFSRSDEELKKRREKISKFLTTFKK